VCILSFYEPSPPNSERVLEPFLCWTRRIHYLQRPDSGLLFRRSFAHAIFRSYATSPTANGNLQEPPSNPQANNLTLFVQSISEAIGDERRFCLRQIPTAKLAQYFMQLSENSPYVPDQLSEPSSFASLPVCSSFPAMFDTI
jgi:hypothetical protein